MQQVKDDPPSLRDMAIPVLYLEARSHTARQFYPHHDYALDCCMALPGTGLMNAVQIGTGRYPQILMNPT